MKKKLLNIPWYSMKTQATTSVLKKILIAKLRIIEVGVIHPLMMIIILSKCGVIQERASEIFAVTGLKK